MSDITRLDLCHANDEETKARLLEVIAEFGGIAEDGAEDAVLGIGVNRFVVGLDELTVYTDAWGVDIAGPDPLVKRVLAAMAGP
jgi:hypothetical protein